jgi:hypothetical protein
MAAGSGGRSGASSRTFNQEIFEKEFAFAGVERTAAAKARLITLGRWPWQGFKSDNFVLCRADGCRFASAPGLLEPPKATMNDRGHTTRLDRKSSGSSEVNTGPH